MLQIPGFTSNSDVVVMSMKTLRCLASLKVVLQGLISVFRRMVRHMVFVNQVIVNFSFDDRLILIFQIILNLVFFSLILLICWVPEVVLFLRNELNSHLVDLVLL